MALSQRRPQPALCFDFCAYYPGHGYIVCTSYGWLDASLMILPHIEIRAGATLRAGSMPDTDASNTLGATGARLIRWAMIAVVPSLLGCVRRRWGTSFARLWLAGAWGLL